MGLDYIRALCIEKWRRERLTLLPPAEQTEVRRTWDGFGKQPAKDIILLYTTVGGFANHAMDDVFFWTLWRWDELRDENAEYQREGVMFCDHSIQAVNWEVRFEDDLRSSVWNVGCFGSDRPIMTAPSLQVFFEIYLEDPWLLMDAWGPYGGEMR
jgi:hypothetical protein